jgi:hypothetical protein
MPTRHEVLNVQVFVDGNYLPFGDITAHQARQRGTELREAVGWGPTTRVAPVASSWSEFARLMEGAGAQKVSDLAEDVVLEYAERLWIVPPGGSIL